MNNKKCKSKPEAEEFTFSIGPTGTITAIYDDRLSDFLMSGKTTIIRASFVEPNESGEWVADMSPLGGPKLPACKLREHALQVERGWLEAHLFCD